MKWAVAAAIAVATVARADAAPPKVIVLPLDGDAPPAVRDALAGELADAARAVRSDVGAGTTTFRESAAAVGCDPAVPACATTVLATLGVDEIVYGTATAAGATTHVQIARVTRDQRRDQAFDVATGDAPDGRIRALFGALVTTTTTTTRTPPPPPPPPAGTAFFDARDRKLGFAFVASGALAVVIGLAVWATESSLQTQIDNAPNATLDDIEALRALEDHANNYAWGGNALVVLGLAAGGVGAYYLWSDHRARATLAPVDRGAAVVVEGTW